MIHLDFETYSEAGYRYDDARASWVSVKSGKPGIGLVGAAVYAQHPSTEVRLLAYDPEDGLGRRLWVEGMDPPEELFELIAAGHLVVAQNSMFEYWVWLYVCHERWGWPELPLAQMRDLMPQLLMSGLPAALGNVGKAIPLPFDKMTEGKDYIKTFSCPPRRAPEHDIDKWQRFCKYNLMDVKVEDFIWQIMPEMSDEELEVWQLDQRINDRGVYINMEAVDACLVAVDRIVKAGNEQLCYLTDGEVMTTRETEKLGNWLAANGLELPLTKTGKYSVTKDNVAEALERDDLSTLVREVLVLRVDLSLSSVDKLYTIAHMTGRGQRIRGMLQYYGAQRTGRWAGRGPQPQNLKSEACDDVAGMLAHIIAGGDCTLKDISGVLRGVFCAAPGKDLICSDYKAIEAVVMAFVSGEQWRMDVFNTHGNIYETSASKISGVPYEEMIAHKERTGKDHPLRKTLGKIAELSGQYQGWIGAWKQFGADKHFDNDRAIKDAILKWRDESPAIVEFWGDQMRQFPGVWKFYPERYGVEGAVVNAIENPDVRQVVNEHISYLYDSKRDVLLARLPSGRELVYPEPRLRDKPFNRDKNLMVKEITFMRWRTSKGKDGTPPGWVREQTYGGRLVENLIQAISRDLLAYAMVQLDRERYDIILHIHDEVVAEIPEGTGDLEHFESVMSRTPDWAAGWPVKAVGGWIGKMFRK